MIAEQGELSKLEESLNPDDYARLYYEGEQLKIAIKDSVSNGAMARTVAQSGLDADFVEVTYSMSDLLNAHEIIEKSLEEMGAKAVGINTEDIICRGCRLL